MFEMTRYRVDIRRKDYEFSFEEENLKAFKDGLEGFIDIVEQFGKPVARASTSSKRGGGRRPPFIKSAIGQIMEKEPEWLIRKFPKDVAEKLKTQYGVPGAKEDSVKVALLRFFKKGSLTREEIQGKYAYSVLSVPRQH